LDLDRDDGKYLSPDADRNVRNLYTLHRLVIYFQIIFYILTCINISNLHGWICQALVYWLPVSRSDVCEFLALQYGLSLDSDNHDAGVEHSYCHVLLEFCNLQIFIIF
jgi:hypothetical protein